MYGKNPIRKPVSSNGLTLEVKHMFPTLQGEGPHVGVPSVFIRLGGCNLACTFCDTDFEEFTTLDVSEVVKKTQRLSQNEVGEFVRKLVVITGGEPLRQNIAPLCEELLAVGFSIQVETNGTLYRELPRAVELVCSPKNTGNGYAMVRSDVLLQTVALKFIISAADKKYHDVPEIGQTTYHIPVFVQPMDEHDEVKNRANYRRAVELAMRYGYRLSLQTHKILGIE